jgi:hypothetical protein
MKYTLNLSRWVNGDSVGRGAVMMLNPRGFSCCLGQFALQMGAPEKECMNEPTPHYVAHRLGYSYDQAIIDSSFALTPLGKRCMLVNDDCKFKGQRVELLREALEAAGHELEVVE